MESTIGVGSIFSFTLTFDLADTADISSMETTADSMEKPNFAGEVLVCEDNSLNQQVICEHLKKVGLKTVVAQNGREGVDLVAERVKKGEKPFDIIFMDIHMPEMDGLEASSLIVSMAIATPIIATTANIMSNDLELYRASGMYDCLGKPFTSQELWKCLMKYLPVISFSTTDQHYSAEKEQFQEKLKEIFVKTNQTTYDDILKAVDNNDIRLAHRLAHTLKSNAGQIGEKLLQEAAAAVEALLANEKKAVDEDILRPLKTELESVLHKLEPLLMKTDSEIIEPITDTKKIHELIENLEPLLQSNNAECLAMLDDIRAIPGAKELAKQIDDFNFKQAREELTKIKKEWL